MERRQFLISAGCLGVGSVMGRLGETGAWAEPRKAAPATGTSLESTPADWLAFWGVTEGPLPENVAEATPRLMLLESGRLIWLATSSGRPSWRERDVAPDALVRIRKLVEGSGLLKLEAEGSGGVVRNAATTHLGARVGAQKRVVRVRGLDQLAAKPGAEELVKAAKEYRETLLAYRAAEGRAYQPEVIRVWIRAVGSNGQFPAWPVSPPNFSPEGYAYYSGNEARTLVSVAERQPRLRLAGINYEVNWAPALQMPGLGGAEGGEVALKAADPVTAQLRWDGEQSKPMPAFWLFANRPVPSLSRPPAMLLSSIPGDAMVTLYTAAVAAQKQERPRTGSGGADGYTFAFERAGQSIPSFRLSRSASREVLGRLAVLLKTAKNLTPGLPEQLQAAANRLSA